MRTTKIAPKLVIAAALILAACTPKEKVETKKVVITVKSQMEADELAQAGEQLLSPTTFHLADKVFEMVLQKDPKNTKAQLYRTALKPWMYFKGILSRVRPLVVKYGNEAEYVSALRNDVRESPLKSWLLDGPEDITKASQIQDLLVKFRDASEEFRKYLKTHPDLDLTIYLNEFVFKSMIDQRSNEECHVLDDDPNNLTVECDRSQFAQVRMNPADVIMLRQLIAGQVLYATMYSSYSVNGIESVFKSFEDMDQQAAQTGDNSTLSTRKIEVLEKIPGFGLLRKDHGLNLVRDIGADFHAAMDWAEKFQAELCPTGTQSPLNRKGFIFESGVCIQTADEKNSFDYMFRLLGNALSTSGLVATQIQTSPTESRDFMIRPMAIFDNPVTDLRTVLPVKYDRCGHAVELRDKTLGGIFVNADVNDTLFSTCVR